jgi:hypothetical protein
MSELTPQEICESLLGLSIHAIEINTDDEFILFTLDNGRELEFTGDGLEMFVSNSPQTDS